VISENASRLTDVVRLAPHVQEGKVVGFRVNPGRDRATFEALGLQAGDVVTDINGTVLDDPSQGLQVFEALGETTQANVTVLREGTPQVIVIDTTQLKKLQEKRE
jgi:general secretion pathway protein C